LFHLNEGLMLCLGVNYTCNDTCFPKIKEDWYKEFIKRTNSSIWCDTLHAQFIECRGYNVVGIADLYLDIQKFKLPNSLYIYRDTNLLLHSWQN